MSQTSRTSHRLRTFRTFFVRSPARGRIAVFSAVLAFAAAGTSHARHAVPGVLEAAASHATRPLASLAGKGFWPTLSCDACIVEVLGGTIFFPPPPYQLASDGDVLTCLAKCGDVIS